MLKNVQYILKWDKEIVDVVEIDTNEFMILRNQQAFNHQETIKVSSSNDKIVYVSTEGRIQYRIVWEIEQINENRTKLSQNLYLENGFYEEVIEIIKPVVKNAFAENLYNLKKLCEMGVSI
ncbi:hypothetical protein KF201_0736 [Lactococcus lactis subsp. lactis]|nr:hypothetical protein KF201_0736 [Lactococcus lactis subsp. lactis]